MGMLAAAVQKGQSGVPTQRVERAAPTRMIAEAQRDMLADQLQDLLNVEDASQHEDDIMFVIDVAMKQFGVRIAEDLKGFVDGKMSRANESSALDEGGRHFAPDAMVEQLAKYLRYREQVISQ